MLMSFGHVRATILHPGLRTSSSFKYPACRNTSQLQNMLCSTMLRHVSLKCCVKVLRSFGRSLQSWAINVGTCCVDMLRSFRRGFRPGKPVKVKLQTNTHYSPVRCSDCAKLKPDFEAAAKDFARKRKFVFAKVSAYDDRFHCQLLTLFKYQHGCPR